LDRNSILIIRTFGKNDIKQFRSFLRSPFFRYSPKVLKLFNFIAKQPHTFEWNSLSDEELHKSIFPETVYNRSTFTSLFSKLHSDICNYLMITNLMNKPLKMSDHLRDEFFKRGLPELAGKLIEKSELQLNNIDSVDAAYFLSRFELAGDKVNWFYLAHPRTNRKKMLQDIENIDQRGMYLAFFFAMEMIRELDNLLSLKNTYEIPEKGLFVTRFTERLGLDGIIDHLIKECEPGKYKSVLEVNKKMLEAFSAMNNDSLYYNYKRTIRKHIRHLSIDDRRFHFGRLARYCILRRREAGTNLFENELFLIYSEILKKGYYRSSVTIDMPAELFRNILILALRLKKFGWTKRFIDEYSEELSPKRRKNLRKYALARYFFATGKFEDAVREADGIDLDDLIFKLDIRNLVLMSYIEMRDHVETAEALDSYLHFVSSDRAFSKNQRKSYGDFAEAVRQLLKLQMSEDPNSEAEYKLLKRTRKHLPFREWVMKKFEEECRRVVD
jgi:hypothetical protein